VQIADLHYEQTEDRAELEPCQQGIWEEGDL
jgi:hypothetical protein